MTTQTELLPEAPATSRESMAPPHHQEFVAGRATFVDDIHRPGALAAVVVRSAQAHGLLRSVDGERARSMPGVRAVLTAADLPSVPIIQVRSFERPGMATAVQPVIAKDRVRYVGEPVAVVVAEDPYTAEDAAERVAVDIEPLTPVIEPDAAANEPLFDRPEANLLCRWESAQGDIDAVLARAAVVVDEEFRIGRHTGVPIEARGLVAEWSADERTLRLWGPTKFLSFTRRTIASWFGLEEHQVDCQPVSVGGMFGVRGELYPEEFLIPWAARVTGRPVRWCEDRREHLLAINHAPGLRYNIQLGLGDDGRLLGFRGEVAVDMGAYVRTNGGRLVLLAIEELPGPYVWDATSVIAEGWATSKAPVGSVRAPVALESTFVREHAIDMAARRLGMDPAEVRRRSLVPATSIPFTRRLGGDVHDHVYEDGDFPSFFDRLLELADYRELCTARDRRRAQGELVGVGIGLFVAHSGLGQQEEVTVGVRQGRITVSTAASEVGQGLDRMVRLVAAEALAMPGEYIDVVSGTTDAETPTRGTFSSRLTIFVGNAVRDGCERLLDEARRIVAARTGVSADSVALVDGGLEADDTRVPWNELDGIEVVGSHRDAAATYGFGGHVAMVSLDAQRSAITVERLALACDCGRAVDLGSVHDQLRGGAVHGLGVTLLEELHYDGNGEPLSVSFMDYLVPTCAEVPADLRIAVLDGWAKTNRLGVKGAGEAGVIGVGAAVANAVADALGPASPPVTRLPLSPPAIDGLMSATSSASN